GFQILGVDHNESSDEALRRDLTQTMESFTKDRSGEFHPDHIDDETWGFVRERIRFKKGDFEDPASYAALKERLTGNVVFYL
ncbi:glucose-6-phosphate dehydrogenase, partial [Klebsiella pneumoniae]|nr:glucose-6-phosphate dehydrogenase [Klebsiella pneumoniae]